MFNSSKEGARVRFADNAHILLDFFSYFFRLVYFIYHILCFISLVSWDWYIDWLSNPLLAIYKTTTFSISIFTYNNLATTTTSPDNVIKMPSLDTLPTEILHFILEYTSSSTQYHLLSTCRQLDTQVAPILYRDVTLNVREEDQNSRLAYSVLFPHCSR